MKELKIGTFSNKEIAEWFGISPVGFSKTKKQKLEILKEFANYEITATGKIQINEVRIPIYVKPTNKTYKYYLENVPKAWTYNEPETCTRVAAKIFDPKNNIRETTGYEYTRLARNELWGKPNITNPKCRYQLAKMYRGKNAPEDNEYEAFTDDDYKIHDELFQKYIAPSARQATTIYNQVKDQELTKEEAFELLFPEKPYQLFLAKLSAELGCDWVVNATIVDPKGGELEESAF